MVQEACKGLNKENSLLSRGGCLHSGVDCGGRTRVGKALFAGVWNTDMRAALSPSRQRALPSRKTISWSTPWKRVPPFQRQIDVSAFVQS